MPLQVAERSVDREPCLRFVDGVHAVALQLPRRNRGERIVGVGDLDGAVQVPVVGRAQSRVQDAAVLVDRHRAVGCLPHQQRDIVRSALADDVRTVTVGEGEHGASAGVPGAGNVVDHEPLAEVVRQGRADGRAAFKSVRASFRAGSDELRRVNGLRSRGSGCDRGPAG